MLVGTDLFPVGASSVLALTFEFTPDSYTGPYLNTATASGSDPNGDFESDDSEDAATPSSTQGASDVASPTLFTVSIPTVPISLGSFSARQQGDVVVFNWFTQTEVANVGFNLYARIDDEWVYLNDEIILSKGDSVALQSYEFVAPTEATIFSLSDVDLTGNETLHGPFTLGQTHGVVGERRIIDWQAEQAERQSKASERKARRDERQRQRIERRMQLLKQRQSNADASER